VLIYEIKKLLPGASLSARNKNPWDEEKVSGSLMQYRNSGEQAVRDDVTKYAGTKFVATVSLCEELNCFSRPPLLGL